MGVIALVTDGQGWIVDRISRIYQQHIPGVDIYTLAEMTGDKLVHLARSYRVIHFNNFFVRSLQPFFEVCPARTIVSIRSFRYPAEIAALTPTLFHVIHPDLQANFPGARFIPDGIDLEHFAPSRPLRVGIAYQSGHEAFKGVELLREASQGLEVELVEASQVPHARMKAFYESLDLYFCGSLSEGFAAPVAECLALNVPVMSTATGLATYLPGIQVVERSVEGFRAGLLSRLTRRHVQGLAWPGICAQVGQMYRSLLAGDPSPARSAAATPRQTEQEIH